MSAKCFAKQLLTVSGSVVICPSISKAGGGLGTNFPEIFLIFFHIIDKGVLELILDTKFDQDCSFASLMALLNITLFLL